MIAGPAWMLDRCTFAATTGRRKQVARDAGSAQGDGWFTLQIAKVYRHVAAIDIDPKLLEVARVRLMEAGVDLVFMANAFKPSGRFAIVMAHLPARGNDNLG